ncbi:hypothetical protein CY0110_12417 [Crocosphaera chwakensis CCY0110]|uniref:Uncharacterized protein n=1 Tax=Crocosphaera chwakensis CCY0110 TaxID=391612 RepID=A3IXX1_9CHRO|nr:hypothetical protein CY0110_12417 [Crocosphaera chwakensis CCY0110]
MKSINYYQSIGENFFDYFLGANLKELLAIKLLKSGISEKLFLVREVKVLGVMSVLVRWEPV